MEVQDSTLFDTDLQIHRLSHDPPVRYEAKKMFTELRPSAMSSFSMVELKGNYIQSLILLHRKILKANSIETAFASIHNTGGRKASLMLSQLINLLGGIQYNISPWSEAKSQLITILDSQIAGSWQYFKKSVDTLLNDFNCTRSEEAPYNSTLNWNAPIHKCNDSNTKCNINKFLNKHINELSDLANTLKTLNDNESLTKELNQILIVVNRILDGKPFKKENWTCRKIGDLLIGLQSKVVKEIISSNYKEHSVLNTPLQYSFREFPYAKIRSK